MTESIRELLLADEDEHLEFKEAKSNFHFEKLVKYCAALANEGGGSIILGVTDKRPRKVVGSNAFRDLQRTKSGLIDKLRLRIDAEEINNPSGRVVVFTAPARPIGVPIAVDGAYLMRAGQDLVPMTPDQLKRIFDEAGPDFSAEICRNASLSDLDPAAIEAFRTRWHRRSKNEAISELPQEQLLRDAELLSDDGINYAALVLLGTRTALGRHLAQAEFVFEYRSSETPGPANQREEFRKGFLLYYDRLWDLVNLRNDRQHYQDGLFMVDIPTFSEEAVREAVLNAVAHRDYRLAGSVFVRQFRRRIEIVSPGGFPQGITPENILDRQLPRNRRIADALARCGLVERSGQGANRIFESCIRDGKDLPDFTHTDDWQVSLTIRGELRDARFVKYLEKIGQEIQASFDTHDLLCMDLIRREETVPPDLRKRLPRMVDIGVLERVGKGRGTRYLLSRRFYAALGKRGAHTRRRGLDREANKALLHQHLVSHAGEKGCPMAELQEVLPGQSRVQIRRLLNELRENGKARLEGERRWARWFPSEALEGESQEPE